jgi:hypothetical protein
MTDMKSSAPDPLQVPRFVAKAAGMLLTALIAVFAIYTMGTTPGAPQVRLLAMTGGPLLLVLLGTSIHLFRNGVGWQFLWQVWSYILVAATIPPVHMLMRQLM